MCFISAKITQVELSEWSRGVKIRRLFITNPKPEGINSARSR